MLQVARIILPYKSHSICSLRLSDQRVYPTEQSWCILVRRRPSSCLSFHDRRTWSRRDGKEGAAKNQLWYVRKKIDTGHSESRLASIPFSHTTRQLLLRRGTRQSRVSEYVLTRLPPLLQSSSEPTSRLAAILRASMASLSIARDPFCMRPTLHPNHPSDPLCLPGH